MKNEFFGRSLFRDVTNGKIRAYNRLMMIRNLAQESNEFARSYIDNFTKDERMVIAIVGMMIKTSGLKAVQVEIKELADDYSPA